MILSYYYQMKVIITRAHNYQDTHYCVLEFKRKF